jgi:hypothetical protein
VLAGEGADPILHEIGHMFSARTKYVYYDDFVRGWAVQIHRRQTGKQGVNEHFKKCQKLLKTKLGEKPGNTLCNLFKELTKNA